MSLYTYYTGIFVVSSLICGSLSATAHSVETILPIKQAQFRFLTQGIDERPAFSADGKSVLFTRWRESKNQGPSVRYSVSIDGKDNEQAQSENESEELLQDALTEDELGRGFWTSPDGKYVAFESNRENLHNRDLYRLFVYSMQDHTVSKVTPSGVSVQHTRWSPDSSKLTFVYRLLDGTQGVGMVDLEGSASSDLISKGTLKKKMKDRLRKERNKQLRRLRR